MSITSLLFILFFSVSYIVFIFFPQRHRWKVLLFSSVIFFVLSSNIYTAVFLLAGVSAVFIACRGMDKNADNPVIRKRYLYIGLFTNLFLLGLLKYSGFIVGNYNLITGSFVTLPHIEAPIGMSFYTLSIIGYLLDVYWTETVAEGSWFKTLLFTCYYPLMTSGPICRYNKLSKTLYLGNSFDWKNLTFGLQRILWGFFKKLVISERTAVLVNTIYGDLDKYNGLYIPMAAGLFMLQLYTDFSGCMDMVIGISECFGIELPENFRTPFFSQTVQEFWQRWHISLGEWLKDYVLFPVLRTDFMKNLQKKLKKKTGSSKKAGRIVSYLGMLCVWILIGLWHGGAWKYIIGQGLWFWFCIVSEQLTLPYFDALLKRFKIPSDNIIIRILCSLRVFVSVCFGNMFFRLDSIRDVLHALKCTFLTFNWQIFFNGDLFELGLSRNSIGILVLAMVLLFVISVLQEKGIRIRDKVSSMGVVPKWGLYIALFYAVILFGVYGPTAESTGFIYKNF